MALQNGMPVGIRIVDATELQLAIDFSHEPWKTMALKIVTAFEAELAELGLAVENQAMILDIINETKGDLQ